MREREGEARKGSKKIGMEQVAKGKDCWSKQIIIDEGRAGDWMDEESDGYVTRARMVETGAAPTRFVVLPAWSRKD